MAGSATFFDGETAVSHEVQVRIDSGGLRISGPTIRSATWPISDVKAIEKPRPGADLRLSSVANPAARLIVPAGPFADRLLNEAPHLASGINPTRIIKTTAKIAAILLAVVATFYGVLTYAPATFASLLPETWRENMGKETEKTVVKNARLCVDPLGQRALNKMVARVAGGDDNPPDFSIRVYDMRLMNAFAVPGGRMVLTRGLIQKAESPEEVAGVIAHELGHIRFHHPEAQLVRLLGLQILISLVTGGGDASTVGELAGIAAILRYSRDAEEQADAYAQRILVKSKINPAGLRDFFKRVLKLQGKIKSKPGRDILSFLSTHPPTQGRIDKLKPLPPNEAISPLTPLEWRALRNICNTKQKTS